jgi:hypothetical protein
VLSKPGSTLARRSLGVPWTFTNGKRIKLKDSEFAFRTVLVESYNTDSEFGARVSPSKLLAARALQFSGFGNL